MTAPFGRDSIPMAAICQRPDALFQIWLQRRHAARPETVRRFRAAGSVQNRTRGFMIRFGSKAARTAARSAGDFDRRLVAQRFVRLHRPETVLGGDRTAHASRDVIDQPGALVAVRAMDGLVGAGGRNYVVVDVAVADVAEGHDAHARQIGGHYRPGAGLLDEVGDARHRHRDVVLPGGALHAFWAADWSSRMAQKALAWASVCAMAASWIRSASTGGGQQALHRRLRRAGLAAGDLNQHEPGMCAVKRIAPIGHVPDHQLDAQRPHQFEGFQRAAALGLGAGQKRNGVAGTTQADKGHGARDQQQLQLQGRGGDHAQRALRPDQQLLQIIAGIVLAQTFQAVPDLLGGQHRLQSPAPGRAWFHSAAPQCRRHWSKPARRWSPGHS